MGDPNDLREEIRRSFLESKPYKTPKPMEEKVDFECPVCGSQEYYKAENLFFRPKFVCSGCGQSFTDPERFRRQDTDFQCKVCGAMFGKEVFRWNGIICGDFKKFDKIGEECEHCSAINYPEEEG